MENLIQLESDRLKANREDLIKLQKLADAAEQTTIDSVDETLQGNFFYTMICDIIDTSIRSFKKRLICDSSLLHYIDHV